MIICIIFSFFFMLFNALEHIFSYYIYNNAYIILI